MVHNRTDINYCSYTNFTVFLNNSTCKNNSSVANYCSLRNVSIRMCKRYCNSAKIDKTFIFLHSCFSVAYRYNKVKRAVT